VDLYGRLNDRQVRVLRWVADGCPADRMADEFFKRTAASLQDRRLVVVSRRRGGWQAEVTDAGRFYLEHGHHPRADAPPPAPRDASSAGPPRRCPQSPPAAVQPDGARAAPRLQPARAVPVPAPTQARLPAQDITPEWVLEQLRRAGGQLRLVGLDAAELAAWRRSAKVAQLRLLRVGRQRLYRWAGDGELTLKLGLLPEPDADDDDTLTDEEIEHVLRAREPPPVVPRTAEFRDRHVPLPSKAASTDPLVQELLQALDRQERRLYGYHYQIMARRKPVVRMRRLWQAIINEARFRGYTVHVSQNHRDAYDAGGLVVRIGPDDCKIHLDGDTVTPLRLRVSTDPPQRRDRGDAWTDADGVSVEQRLGEVFTRIEQLAEQQIEQREAQRCRDERQRQARLAAETRARQAFAEDHRRRVIAQRIEEVRYTDDVRAYGQRLRAAVGRAPEGRRDAVRAWAQWAEQYAESIDPRCTLAGAPVVPDPDWSQLRSYGYF
jgi:hypothetical protein